MSSLLSDFERALLRCTVSSDRVYRLAVLTLLEGDFSVGAKSRVLGLFSDYGYTEEEAQSKLDGILRCASSFEVRPGPIVF